MASVRDLKQLRLYEYMKTSVASPLTNPLTQETFQIPGITCGGCVRRLTGILQQLPVKLLSISVGLATVSYDITRVSREQIVETVWKAGYAVK